MKVRVEKTTGLPKSLTKTVTETVEAVVNRKLRPVLGFYRAADSVVQVAIARRKDKTIHCKIHWHVPGKKILVAEGEGPNVEAAAKECVRRLLREARRHIARLRAQDEFKRKERRKRLRELKTRVAEVPEPTRLEAEKRLSGLADRLKSVVGRELAYLHATGELPTGYPTVDDVVDEAVASTICTWKVGESEAQAWEDVLRNAFEILDREISSSHQYGTTVSLDQKLPPTSKDQAEGMVEEEIYEFYQPDDVLTLADVIPEEAVKEEAAQAGAETAEQAEKTSMEAYSWDVLKDLPREWRRSFLLAKVEGMGLRSIESVLGGTEQEVRGWLEHSCLFVSARLGDAGIPAQEVEDFISSPRRVAEEK